MIEFTNRILAVASDLFFRYGLRNVTMDGISKELGISKKTLYKKYKTKDDIVLTIMRRFLKNHEEDHAELVKNSKNAIDELLKLIEKHNMMFSKMNPAIIYDMQRYFPETWQAFSQHREKCMIKHVTDNLERGIKQGLYRKDIDVAIISRFRIEQIISVFNPAVFPPDKFNINNVRIQLAKHYLYGICSLKGYKILKKTFANVNAA